MLKKNNPALKASILIISLWTVCLLSIFCVYLGYNVRQKITLVKRLEERNKLYYIADAGVKKAIVCLLGVDPEIEYMALNGDWADNPGLFQDIDFNGGSFSVGYNYSSGGATQTRYGLVDEERKVNINTADAGVLRRLFQLVLNFSEGEASGLAYSIIDWRDSDNQLSDSARGAESAYYHSLKYPYSCKNSEFEILEEVLLIKGMSEDISNKIKDYITIYGDGRVNINTASLEVLLALGLSPKICADIIEFRKGKDAAEGTTDDNFFSQNSDIATRLQTRYNLNQIEMAEVESVASNYLSCNSFFFMIRSVARLTDKKNQLEVICVVNRLGDILYWRET
ncbi:MAG: hypothetical protein ABH882_07095 [Candidatus Omnitrophota bacterium]|nr:general secretion pathway protein GspK [Candidatus Omnitrophota bacterium]MBU1928721.1 general secretion pathway protein GspK [Candidatus Omnitrophota bacterium]MBU2034176.1 general secretion pathway protein GspK [Candidatus Omnitrophota bacterium]